jgi:tRNA (cmo5U34)-methyltransferase
MPHSVRRHLRIEVDAYDRTIRRFIPGYETMLAVAADAVATVSPALALDLGAGTGALSEALLERPAIGAVELIDVDPEMLELAAARVARFGARARLRGASYEEPLPACDAVAASLSLHHLPTLERKAAVFGRVFEALQPGGLFVNADATMPPDASGRAASFRHWADHLVASGIEEDRAWRHFEEWSEEDTYLPLDDELAALRSAGFDAACVWRDGPICVVVAEKGSRG